MSDPISRMAADPVAADVHSVDVQGHQVRDHRLQERREAIEVVVAVVEVVDQADVVDPVLLQALDDGDLVLGLAEPAAVVVEGNRAADLASFLGEQLQAGDGRRDPTSLLLARGLVVAQAKQDPELGLEGVTF